MSLFANYKVGISILNLAFLGILAIYSVAPSWADTERITDFEYDNSGNIVRILQNEQSAPPIVSSLSPAFINVGRTVTMTASGTNLLGANVTPDVSGLQVTNVRSTLNEVTFNLTASSQATIGNALLTFTTGLGSDVVIIKIAEKLPSIFTTPNPITISADGTPFPVEIVFSEPRPTDETYTLSVASPSIANTMENSVTINAGTTRTQFLLAGSTTGTTTLSFSLPEKFYLFSFPVYVSGNFVPDSALFSSAIGIYLQPDEGHGGNSLISESVGVVLDSTDQKFTRRWLSQSVGVFVADGSGIGNSLVSLPTGVFVETADGGFANPLLSGEVGLFLGPVLSGVAPNRFVQGTQQQLQITGSNLESVATIDVEPFGAVSIENVVPALDGNSVNTNVVVNPKAATGDYQLIVNSADGEITTRYGTRLSLTITASQ